MVYADITGADQLRGILGGGIPWMQKRMTHKERVLQDLPVLLKALQHLPFGTADPYSGFTESQFTQCRHWVDFWPCLAVYG